MARHRHAVEPPGVQPMPTPRDQAKIEKAKADFFRMVRWIVAIGILMVAGALYYMSRSGPLQPAVVGATIGGVFLSITLGCGLFAAAFFSDKSGYDDAANRPHLKDDPED
jgi:hypothetical protein